MISNQSRGLNKGPGRVSQLVTGCKAFALMQFGFYVGRARQALMAARFRDRNNPDLQRADLEDARINGALARDWFSLSAGPLESEVVV